MTDGVIALDTSVAIPLLVAGHAAHRDVLSWSREPHLALTAHSLAETYSVLTRLPGDLRVAPDDAVRLLEDFAPPLILSVAASRRIPVDLARIGIVGGAVYDALVALAARAHGARIATRDARALDTYRAVGVEVTVVGTAEA